MVGFVSVIVSLLYLGRILAWVSGGKPLEAADAIFLVPLLVGGAVLRSRPVRSGLSRPAVVPHDLLDEAIRSPQTEALNERHREEDTLARQQEWAAAEYHWWKR